MKHIRVAAIIRHQNKILLHTTKNESYWTLPGGAVENELTNEGLQREMREELGEEVIIRDLKIIAENRFVYHGEEIDSIEFYYAVELYPNSSLLELSTFTKIEQFGQYGEIDYELNFKWFEIDKVSEIEILPKFLQTELAQLSSDRIKHIQ